MAYSFLDDPYTGPATKALTPPEKGAPAKPPSDSTKSSSEPAKSSPDPDPLKIGEIGAGSAGATKQVAGYEAEKGKLTPPRMALPPKPEPKYTSPVEMWGSAAMVFAALGSLMTRRPAMAAMNAAAAALNGFQKKDAAAAATAMKTWEIETKNAIQLAEFQQNTYKQAMDSVDRKEMLAMQAGDAKDRAAVARVGALAKGYEDLPMYEALRHGGIAAGRDLQEKREKIAQDFKERQLEAGKQGAFMSARILMEQSPEFQSADSSRKMEMIHDLYDRYEQTKPAGLANFMPPKEVIDREIDEVGQLKRRPYTGRYAQTPHGVAVMNGVTQKYPDYDVRDFDASQQAIKAFGTGKQGDAVRALGVARQHLEVLERLGGALANKDVKKANQIVQAFKEQTGQSVPVEWNAARKFVAGELVKAGQGSGIGALGDRDEVMKTLDRAGSPDQIKDVLQVYKDLIGGQMVGLRNQYETATHRKDFDSRLGPDVAEFFTRKSAGETKSPGGPPPGAPSAVNDKGEKAFLINGQWVLEKDIGK